MSAVSLTQSELESFGKQLSEAAALLNVTLNESQQAALLSYLALLVKWNQAYNLTAVRDPQEMLYRHLVDSLSITRFVQGDKIMDLGTGPGLPGIPMALMYPETEFVLLDSNVKKTRFLTQCCIELSLSNVQVHHGRVESAPYTGQFDQILTRAFSSLPDMVSLSGHLLTRSGKYFAMKGLKPADDERALPDGYLIEECIALDVPGCDAQRHLIIIGKA